jgi:hypothetical protein
MYEFLKIIRSNPYLVFGKLREHNGLCKDDRDLVLASFYRFGSSNRPRMVLGLHCAFEPKLNTHVHP